MTQNTVITWLTQSELKDERPFFDAGLDGNGQIVAVSDTGCDQNNCYFTDPNNVPNVSVVCLCFCVLAWIFGQCLQEHCKK